MSIALICLSASALAQEHDHQQWNPIRVGRLVTLSRMEDSFRASQQALDTLREVGEIFGCRPLSRDTQPRLSHRGPLTRHDRGPLVIAEFDEVRCKLSPTRQLIPVTPAEFSSTCSRIAWKCDVIWISDSDPEVWYVTRSNDLVKK